jgi:hypothetical protein
MASQVRRNARRWRSRAAMAAIALCVVGVFVSTSRAVEEQSLAPPQRLNAADTRTGGVIAQSYSYHQQGPAAAAAPQGALQPANWYGYGFPVQTHRWGWFGAGRYYPTVLWHQGFYGDQCRWGYRKGY